MPGRATSIAEGGLPWTTRPASITAVESHAADIGIPDTLPSRIVARADEPFERFDPEDLRLLGEWLEQTVAHWPRRRSLRREPHRRGKRIDLRETMRASRTTGWETIRLARTRSRVDPRRVVLVCDVSRSMQPYATIYLGSHADSSPAAEGNSPRGLRVLDITDAADRRVVASLGGGGVGHGPMRRSPTGTAGRISVAVSANWFRPHTATHYAVRW